MHSIPSASTALSLFAALSAVLPAAAATPDPAPGGLPRLGEWGFTVQAREGGGVIVARLAAGGAAAEAGLRDGDHVSRVNGTPIDEPADFARLRREFRADARVEVQVERQGRSSTFRYRLPPLPLESPPGCEVSYGAVALPAGYRVRTIVTRPAGARGALPTLVFIPWLSPDAVETPVGPPDGWIQLLHGLARHGWQVVRIEKPGIGDSEGPDCGTNDLETDLAAFRAGLAAARALPGTDTKRVVYFGGSIGGALAPLLAVEHPPAALVVSGGFARTWIEHMLEFERERLALSGRAPEAINDAMRGYAEFYALYLGARLTPGEVLARRPDLAPLWYDAPGGQFGRPASYYHQVAALNMEAIWSRISAPTLILYGDYDWIMSRAEHERMADLVNRRLPGRATLEVLPRTGHNLEQFASRAASFSGDDPRFDPGLVERVAAWLEQAVRQPQP